MAIGGGGTAAAEQFGHGSVFLDQVGTEGIGLPQCLLEGPEDGTVCAFGDADKRVRFRPCRVRRRARLAWDIRLEKGGDVVKVVAEGLGELASRFAASFLPFLGRWTASSCEERPGANANRGGLDVDWTLLGMFARVKARSAAVEAWGPAEGLVGGRSRRRICESGGLCLVSER